jgi:hypothetical protein
MEVSICPSTKKPLKTFIIVSELTKNELKVNYEWVMNVLWVNYERIMSWLKVN